MSFFLVLKRLSNIDGGKKMKNKKGGLASAIVIIILVLIILVFVYVIFNNFHTTCILNNLKSLSEFKMLNMSNCRR